MSEKTFSLDDYDCIGFDLDCTLAEYNVKELRKLVYELLVNYLITYKGYPSEINEKPYEDGTSFSQKGLLMDLKKGNIIKISENGTILQASHGTTPLTEDEIRCIYGENKTLISLQEFITYPICVINTPSEKELRSTLDCFDGPALLLFARVVDFIDKKTGNKLIEYDIWPDILQGLYFIYGRDTFESGKSGFFEAMKKNPSLYYVKWDKKKIQWLTELKKKKFLFMLTGSFIDFASNTAEYCIGENWKDYFDIVLCYGRKPFFFFKGHPFLSIQDNKEGDAVEGSALKTNTVYSQGNWEELKALISKTTGMEDPKCLYVGDNMIQDVFSPVHFNCCDSVAVSLELLDEFQNSSVWGNYFKGNENTTTYWNYVIKTHAKICISNIDVFVDKPTNTQYQCLDNENCDKNDLSKGYYVS